MVSLPDEAAFTICCSTDLFILALSAYTRQQDKKKFSREGKGNEMRLGAGWWKEVCSEGKLALCMAACLMLAAFFGATARRPFFVLAAALCACRALLLLPGLLCKPLVVPWTIVMQV